MRSFLPDDHEVEAERRIQERKQGIDEDIRTFAFQYRALCLRLKPTMTEKEILEATMRNCNPRLASILRGTATTFDYLVRTGTLVEWVFLRKGLSGSNGKQKDLLGKGA